jgi:hypothetical protein
MNEVDTIIYKLLTCSRELTREAISDTAHIPLPEVRAGLQRLMLEMKAGERSVLAGLGPIQSFATGVPSSSRKC